MSGWIYFVIYIFVCGAINFCPVIRDKWKEFIGMIRETYKDADYYSSSHNKRKTLKDNTGIIWTKTLIIVLAVFTTVILFILFPIILPFTFNEKKTMEDEDDKCIYFKNMTGLGKIYCSNCEYNESIVSLLRNGSITSWTGLQCKKCGEFERVQDLEKFKLPIYHYCGGALERDNPLFCPKCKSKNMHYHLEVIT